jgi:(1->4)-alpha-D-glucan 1-alpha-D-glucosylmutase
LTHRLLRLRAEFPDLFLKGGYEPLEVIGPHRDSVIAFARVLAGQAIIVAVGRHFAAFTEGGRRWPKPDSIEAAIEPRGFRVEHDLLRNQAFKRDCVLPISIVFENAPVMVLKASGARPSHQ